MLQPAGTAANWPCRQQFFFSRRSGVPAIETAPTPVFRTFHQLRPQSIAFHIPAHRQKVVIVLNRIRFESPLIQMTRTSRFAMRIIKGVRNRFNQMRRISDTFDFLGWSKDSREATSERCSGPINFRYDWIFENIKRAKIDTMSPDFHSVVEVSNQQVPRFGAL